jgi:hypothetical protein
MIDEMMSTLNPAADVIVTVTVDSLRSFPRVRILNDTKVELIAVAAGGSSNSIGSNPAADAHRPSSTKSTFSYKTRLVQNVRSCDVVQLLVVVRAPVFNATFQFYLFKKYAFFVALIHPFKITIISSLLT